MSMNKFMHPRNIYRQKPDFQDLVKQYPELNQVASVDLNGRVKLDYKNKTALCLLTCCLLKRDFGLELELPPDKLIPTLPLRLNYILWLEDLEQALGWKARHELRGVDIGCGASCIYPLLGVASSKRRWKMVALEQAEDSVEHARANVERNGFGEEVEVVQQEKDEQSILKGFMDRRNDERFDFSMCNPPFYDDLTAEGENRTGRRKEPSNALTGSRDELRTEGGELSFVEKIIQESLELKERIAVYTSMVGHKRNFEQILKIFKSHCINNVTTTRFCQGNTTRWGVAWSFSSAALLSKAPDPFEQNSAKRKSPGKPLEGRIFTLEEVASIDEARTRVMAVLSSLDLKLHPLPSSNAELMWEIIAQENTWSHQRRRRRQERRKLSPGGENQRNEQLEDLAAPPFGESPCKRIKSGDAKHVLKAALCLKKKTDDGYYLVLSYIEGIAGKDALNQILQHVKNTVRMI